MFSESAPALPTGHRPPVFADTKFRAPQPPAWLVPRTDLIHRLDTQADLEVAVVVGAAGSGKTTLLADWITQQDPLTTAWISADRGDDPFRFLHAAIRAIRQLVPDFGIETTDVLTLDGLVSPDAIESFLVEESRLTHRIHLVIDDVHFVDPATLRLLRHLLSRGLVRLHPILGSRTNIDIGIERLRLRREVCEIDEVDLRLDLEQATELLRRLRIDVGAIDVAELHRRTEGWVAGLHLAALALARPDSTDTSIDALASADIAIADYLIAELFERQPHAIQRFLEDTCVVDEFDLDMWRALTDDCTVTPNDVEQAHLMLFRVDGERTVYRYHALFAEMLREHLRSRDPERYRRQHRRAADAALGSGDASAALHHIWQTGDRQQAAHLIAENLLSDHYRTGGAPLRLDSDLFGGNTAEPTPLSDIVGYGIALIVKGHHRDVLRLVDRIEEQIDPGELPAGARVPILGLRVASSFTLGDTRAATEPIPRLLDLVNSGEDIPGALSGYTLAASMRALVWDGRAEEALELPAKWAPDDLAHEELVNPAFDHTNLPISNAVAHLRLGNLPTAVELCRTALAIEPNPAAMVVTEVTARATLGVALLEMGDLREAAEHLDFVLRCDDRLYVPGFLTAATGYMRLLRAQGRFDAAFNLATRTRGRGITSPTGALARLLDQTEVAVRLAVGDIDAAGRLLANLPSNVDNNVLRAWLEMSQGRTTTAGLLIEPLVAQATNPRHQLVVTLARLKHALLVHGDGAAVDALAAEALACAAPSESILPIAESGGDVLRTVMETARRQPRTPYIERLLATPALPRGTAAGGPKRRHEELSAREQIVLQYLATSMTNQEIADALFLSVNTVKTHIRNVLRKLGAGSRAEAVQRAHEYQYL